MGSGRWSTDVYTAAASFRAASGRSAFDYSDTTMRSAPRSSWKAHDSLNPHGVAVRESRDSVEHPTSLPIAVLFDVTGSMRSVPRTLQEKLPTLFGLLQDRGYALDPQVLFGAIGDATCDRVPLQVGQFESDNRSAENLQDILLEGGGGGQMSESYELAMYFLARHTSLDSVEKRGKRGYLFIIGDELAYTSVKANEIRSVIGDDVREDIPLEVILSELKAKFEVYYLLPAGSSYAGSSEVLSFWRGLLGQNVLEIDDLSTVSEVIALTVGISEGNVDRDTALADVTAAGVDPAALSRSLASLPAPALAVSSLPALAGSDDVDRL